MDLPGCQLFEFLELIHTLLEPAKHRDESVILLDALLLTDYRTPELADMFVLHGMVHEILFTVLAPLAPPREVLDMLFPGFFLIENSPTALCRPRFLVCALGHLHFFLSQCWINL